MKEIKARPLDENNKEGKMSAYMFFFTPFLALAMATFMILNKKELFQNDMIALLPRPLEYFVDKNKFKVVRFKDPVPFNIWFCRPYKANYNEVEAYVYEELLKGYYQPLSEPHPQREN